MTPYKRKKVVFRCDKPLDEQIKDAPKITPLMKISNSERDELIFKLFNNAKQKVFQMLSIKHKLSLDNIENIYNQTITHEVLTKDNIETAVHRECDRLIEVYNKVN